ncbi:MAG: hypothetical protein RLZZ165_2134 [Bacteroidota bacterium]
MWTIGVVLGLVAALVVLGYAFEDKIHLMAIKAVENAVNADIEVEDTDVSFLRSWPKVRVSLVGVTLNPRTRSDEGNAIAMESANFKVGFWSIFTDHFKVHEVRLVEPDVRLVMDQDGNWNFTDMFQPPSQPDTLEEHGNDPVFELYSVRISDGHFHYADLRDGGTVDIDSIQIGMRGDFSAERSDIETRWAVHVNDWKSARATFAHNKHVQAHVVADVQFGEHESYTLKTAEVDIAALKLVMEGVIAREKDVFDFDLKFASGKSSFESFLSILPGGLLDTGREYEYSGEFMTHGWVRGQAGSGHTPSLHVDYGVTQGAFHYVGYDSKLTGVNMLGEFHLEAEDPSASHFEIKKFKASLHDKALTGNLLYANFNNPRLAVAVMGDLSLQDVRDFYPAFADSTQMSGNVKVDARVEGRIADFQGKNYDAIKAFGGMRFQSLRLQDPRLHLPFENLTGEITLDNYRIEVGSLVGKVGHSDFNVKGTVTEYLPWIFNQDATIKGVAELRSTNLDLDEWFTSDPAGAPQSETEETDEETFVFELPRNVDFQLITQVGKLNFAKLEATAVNGRCRLRDQQLILDDLQMKTLDGSCEVNGSIQVTDPSHCQVRLDGIIREININKTFRTFEQLAAFALVKENLYGIFSGEVHIGGKMDQHLELDANSLVSTGNVSIQDGKLINFKPLEGLAGFMRLEDLMHIEFSDITTEYRIGEQNFYIPKMSLKANRHGMEIVGKHGFDNSLDYKVYVELPRKEARNSRNQEVLQLIEENQDDPVKIVIPVHITGTVDEPKYRLEGKYVAAKLEEHIKKQGDELKEGWKKEMEETWGRKDTNQVDDLVEVRGEASDSIGGGRTRNALDKFKKPFDKIKKPIQSIGDRFGR